MPTFSPIPVSNSSFPTTSATTAGGVTHIDLNFVSAMSKGSGTIFVTDGAVQTVIDRITGQPKLRVVGGTFSKEISLDKLSFSGTHVMFDVAGLPPGAKPNVYMAAGTLTSGGKAASAITVPGTASFTVPDATVEPGSLTATIALDGNGLTSGQHIKVTITFSKAVESLGPDVFAAGNATIGDFATEDGGKTWTARLAGQAAKDAPSNVLRLDMDRVTASDGSHGAGVVSSASYLVDTLVAAWIDTTIDMHADEGPHDTDGVTNEDTMSVGGTLHGSLKDGEYIELIINGRTIPSDKIWIEPSSWEWGKSYWYYSNDAEHFNPDIVNTVQARVVGPGNHASLTATKTIVIDTDAPAVVSAPAGPIDAGGSVSIVFDEAMYFSDNVEVTEDIEVIDSFGNRSWISLDGSNLSSDRKTLTLSAADHKLASGNSYTFRLPDSLTDLAGNGYEGAPIVINTSGDYEDKAPPRLVKGYVTSNKTLYGKGDTLEIRLGYSEKVTLDADTATDLALELSNGGSAAYTGMSSDGKEMIFTYTVGANEDADWFGLYIPWNRLPGHVYDEAGNAMQDAHIEYDGSLAAEDGYGVRIDTVVATPEAPRLHPSSDTGTEGDFITEDATPLLYGARAEIDATISLWIGDAKIGSTTVDLDGRWDTVIASPLPVGTHQIRATQEDRAGNVSELSDPFTLTIVASTAPTTLSTPVLDADSDTGPSNSDRITRLDHPIIRGTGPANATLKLMQNGFEITTVATDPSGNWHYRIPSLEDGTHDFAVQQGENGPSSAVLSITVDGSNPWIGPEWAEHVRDFDLGRDLVISFSEAVHIEASEGEEDMLVMVDEDDNIQKIAVSDANLSSDKRTLTISSADYDLLALTDYRVQLPATLTDLAGNGMGEYHIYFRTGNDALPSAVRAVVNGDGSYTAGETITIRVRFNEQVEKFGEGGLSLGLSNNLRAVFTSMGGVGNDEALFSYTVEPGTDYTDVRITDTSELVGRFVDLSGNLLDNAHISLDDLYDGSGYGARIDIDTVAAAPGAPVLASGSDSGISNSDGITNITTPTFSGSGAESGATVVLYAGTREIGRKTADASGNWTLTVAEADKFTAGSYAITAKQTDRAGNTSDASSSLSLVIDTAAPEVSGFSTNTGLREFRLGFTEQIVFRPTGMFKLVRDLTEWLNFSGSSSANWYTTDSAAGQNSVLNFKISMSGLYNLQMNNESVQDLAGNVAIIGSPQWIVDLPQVASP